MFPLAVVLGIGSYAVFYYGQLAVRGFPALYPFRTIGFLDVVLPSRLPKLQQWLAAGPQKPTGAAAAAAQYAHALQGKTGPTPGAPTVPPGAAQGIAPQLPVRPT